MSSTIESRLRALERHRRASWMVAILALALFALAAAGGDGDTVRARRFELVDESDGE